MPTGPGVELNLSAETREALGKELAQVVQDLESDHYDYFENLGAYWDYYDAKPLQRVRADPWRGASNTVVPLIRTAGDALAARIWGRMHTPLRTWIVRTANEDTETIAHTADEFMNREARTTFDISSPTYDWALECAVLGSAVTQVAWEPRFGYRWVPRGKDPQLVELSRGPVVRHVSRERCLWERDRTIAESSVFAKQSLLTNNDISRMVLTHGWDETAARDIAQDTGITGPTAEILQSKREKEGQAGDTGNYSDPHDVREVWIDWAMADLVTRRPGNVQAPEFSDPADPRIPIVVTIHRNTGRVLRAIAHPYYFDGWPFHDIYFRKKAGRGAGDGVASILEQLQRTSTQMLNQSVDATTLNTSLKILTQNPRHKNLRFTPFHFLFVDNLADVQAVNIPHTVGPDINLINMVTVMAERLTGISDPNLGRETRLGGHPSPATNTLVQLEEGSRTLNMTMRGVRKQLALIGERIFSLYQQYELTDTEGGLTGRLAAEMGEADAERLAMLAISPETFQFDVHALSEAANPEAEQNKMVVASQMTANYYSYIMRMFSVLENPQTQAAPGLRASAIKAIDSYTRIFTRFLQSSEIDDAEKFAVSLRETQGENLELIEQFKSYVQEAASGLQPQQPPGGPGGPPGIQAASPGGEVVVPEPQLGPGNGASPPPGRGPV
jgi:hypothetical protein